MAKSRKDKWMLFVQTEEKIWLLSSGKRSAMKKHYKHWCTLDKDTYNKAILSVYLVKSKDYQDTLQLRFRREGLIWCADCKHAKQRFLCDLEPVKYRQNQDGDCRDYKRKWWKFWW